MIVFLILAAPLATAIVGIVALVRAGVAREERGRSLADRPDSRAEAATRWIVGWHGEPPRIRSAADRQAADDGSWPGTCPLTLVSGR